MTFQTLQDYFSFRDTFLFESSEWGQFVNSREHPKVWLLSPPGSKKDKVSPHHRFADTHAEPSHRPVG